jgi:hypothetical protein
MFSVALYEEPTSDDNGKASRNFACESPETMTKKRFSPTVSCTKSTTQVNANVHAYIALSIEDTSKGLHRLH